MKHSYFDLFSEVESPVHRREARSKIIFFFALIVSIVLTPPAALRAFALFCGLVLVVTLIARVPVSFVLKRSAGVIPFVLLIGLFVPFLHAGEELVGLNVAGIRLSVTERGALLFWNMLIKSFLCAASMVLLTATTPFPQFLKGVNRMGLPRLMVMVLSFMYRYIFVIEDEFESMRLARSARTAGGNRWLHLRVQANSLGVLFIRSYERAEAVYLAMCSRGFTGDIRTLDQRRLSASDFLFAGVGIAVAAAIRLMGAR